MNLGIMCHSSCGGSARIAIDKAIALARRSHAVHLFVRSTPFMAPSELSGVELHTLDGCTAGMMPSQLEVHWSSEDMEAMTALVLQVIAEQGLEVLHVHYALPFAFIARKISQRSIAASPLLVGTLHGTDVSPYGLDPVINLQLADTLKDLHILTTSSTSLANQAVQIFKLETRPRIIPGFVDTRRFFPKKNRANAKPKILHISNFRPVKTPQAVAKIFACLREQIEAELWLVGDGEEMDRTKNTLQNFGLENDVRYWGLCRDVPAILRQADLLVMPSRSESFCLAALEAMACGVPVLASDVGGLPEVVLHNRTGFLFPADDYAAAAHYAVQLLQDPGLYQFMSAAAVRQARRFDQEQVVSLYENLYHRLAAQEQP